MYFIIYNYLCYNKLLINFVHAFSRISVILWFQSKIKQQKITRCSWNTFFFSLFVKMEDGQEDSDVHSPQYKVQRPFLHHTACAEGTAFLALLSYWNFLIPTIQSWSMDSVLLWVFIFPFFSINKTFKRRWFVLGCFCLLSVSNAITWITFAPISDKTEKQFGISTLWVSV